MFRTPARGITGVLLPSEAKAPAQLKNMTELKIPMMNSPHSTANVIFKNSFIFVGLFYIS